MTEARNPMEVEAVNKGPVDKPNRERLPSWSRGTKNRPETSDRLNIKPQAPGGEGIQPMTGLAARREAGAMQEAGVPQSRDLGTR